MFQKFSGILLLLLSMRSEANACFQDSQKFCSDITPGKGQIAKCLEGHMDQVSSECAIELKEFKKKSLKRNPCFEDLTELCSNVPPLSRKLEYCLLHHESRLSNTCSADFKKKKGNLIVKDPCAQDIANNCYSSLSDSEGSTNLCLLRNRNQLSINCRKIVDAKVIKMKKANPCFDETEKYCAKEVRFVDIHECMKKKLPVLSAQCKVVVQKEISKEQKNPCYMDLRRHCKTGLSTSEQFNCLTLNENHLSAQCREFRNQESVKVKNLVKVCEKDRLKLCPTTPFKDGLVLKCLKEKIDQVSTECKSLLK